MIDACKHLRELQNMIVIQRQSFVRKYISKIVNLVSTGILASLLMVPGVKAITIEYAVQDQGGGAWQYSYYLSGTTFNQYQGFQIYFDYNIYSDIDAFPVAPNADWSPITINPDIGLSLNGVYDAIALAGNPSLADPFVVSFNWSGVGQPSAQDFSLYACDDDFCSTGITFGQTGTTVARSNGGGSNPDPNPIPVPEPFMPMLIALGLFGMFVVRRRG